MHHGIATTGAAVLPSVKGTMILAITWVLAAIAKLGFNELLAGASGTLSILLSLIAGYNYILRIQDVHRERRERREAAKRGEAAKCLDTDDKR